MLQIDVYMDHVEIEGQKVLRPVTISRSAWDEVWRNFGFAISRHHFIEDPWTWRHHELDD